MVCWSISANWRTDQDHKIPSAYLIGNNSMLVHNNAKVVPEYLDGVDNNQIEWLPEIPI